MSFQKFPGLFEFIFIGIVGFLYFMYIIRISWIAIIMRTNFRAVFIKLVVRTIYFFLIVIALMAPSFGDIKKEIKSVGKDIYILVDLSQSMNVQDIQPSRIEKIKFELKRVTEAFSTDRIGLIIFSSDAFVQCPLTFDMGALNLFIETLSTNLVPLAGTDFATALDLTIKRFKSSENTTSKDAKSKIVILISDGEDFGDDTDNSADDLENYGVKLFTLGVGSELGGKVPDENGFKRNENGKYVISKLNSEALKKLADITGGKYYEINEKRNDVNRMLNDINNIEGEVRDIKTVDASANKYFYFLFVALAFIIVDVLITVKTIKI